MAFLRCDKCQQQLPGAIANLTEPAACPSCRALLTVHVFPAFLRPVVRGRSSETLASQEEAGCFYHPHKKAVVPCEDCGRFLCALCDLEIDGRHICPACVEIARQGGKSLRTSGQRTLHDQVALTLAALGPAIIGWGSIIAAPITLFMVVRYWNEPARSPVPRTRARLIVAGSLALLEIAGWSTLLYFYLHRPSRGF